MSVSAPSSPSLSPCPQSQIREQQFLSLYFNPKITLHSPTFLKSSAFNRASRRSTNFSQVADDRRNWSRTIGPDFGMDDEDNDENDDETEEDRSLDLLVRFVQNMFKKISRRARKAVRSVLPLSIPTKLVAFSVNGVLMLTFLWVSKAFLEVICTLGSVVFVSILLIRGIWTGIVYFQETRSLNPNELDADNHTWTDTQPAT